MKKISVTIITLLLVSFVGLPVATTATYNRMVYRAQKRLKELRYNPGPLDGIWGKKTEKAVKEFQQDTCLPVSGELDRATITKLKETTQLPTSRPPIEEDYEKNLLDTYNILTFKYNSSLCLEAEKSEDHLLSRIINSRATPMDVYYFTKTNQVLLTHLSNFLISFYDEKKFLELLKEDLNEQREDLNDGHFSLNILRYNKKEVDYHKILVDGYNAIVEMYNSILDRHKERIDELNDCIEIFHKKIQPFTALLPLEELSRYEYSLEDRERAQIDIQAVPIFVFSDALKLLESGKVEEGSILLDAVGEIKIAYLGVLLISFESDNYAKEKFEVLQRDLIEYYGFVDEILREFDVHPYEITDYVRERLNHYYISKGIFNKGTYGIYKELDRYYNTKTLDDYLESWGVGPH